MGIKAFLTSILVCLQVILKVLIMLTLHPVQESIGYMTLPGIFMMILKIVIIIKQVFTVQRMIIIRNLQHQLERKRIVLERHSHICQMIKTFLRAWQGNSILAVTLITKPRIMKKHII